MLVIVAHPIPPKVTVVAEVATAAPATVASSARIPANDPRIALAVEGDRRAASELLSALLPRVRNLVRFLSAGDADVDDHAQAALMEVMRALPSFEGRSALTTWADRITVRHTLRRLRQARAERARRDDLRHDPEPAAPALDERYVDRRRVAHMLDQLPDEQRQALVLHHVMGMSVPEVAEALEVPFDTIKSRIRLATRKLRALYGGDDD